MTTMKDMDKVRIRHLVEIEAWGLHDVLMASTSLRQAAGQEERELFHVTAPAALAALRSNVDDAGQPLGREQADGFLYASQAYGAGCAQGFELLVRPTVGEGE